MDIGNKLKALRKKSGLTLLELSEKTGIAQSTLSRIEKGLRTGNVKTHLKICQALGIKISQLYAGLGEDSQEEISPIETEAQDVEGFRYNEKAFAVALAREQFKKKMKPELLVISPSHSAKEPGDPPGTEKFIFCEEGQIEVKVNKAAYRLKKGSSLYFNSSLPHYFKNIGKQTAKCLCVSTPVRI